MNAAKVSINHHFDVVRQRDQADCGVACLKSIARYYGFDPPFEFLRNISGTNSIGTTMLGLVQGATEIGLNAKGYSATLQSLKEVQSLGILHTVNAQNYQHYLVLIGYEQDNDRFVIGDPATGAVLYLLAEQLDAIWPSRAVVIIDSKNEENQPFKQYESIKRPGYNQSLNKWSWLKNFLRPDYNILVTAGIIGVFVSLLTLATPIFTQKLIDEILPTKSLSKLYSGCLIFFALLIVRVILDYLRRSLIIKQTESFNNRIVGFFYRKILYLPKRFFDNRTSGDITARLHDTNRIQSSISQIFAYSSIDLLTILSALGVSLYYHWGIMLAIMLWIPGYLLLTKHFSPPILTSQREVLLGYANSETAFIDTISGANAIRSNNRQEHFIEMISNYLGHQHPKLARSCIFWPA